MVGGRTTENDGFCSGGVFGAANQADTGEKENTAHDEVNPGRPGHATAGEIHSAVDQTDQSD